MDLAAIGNKSATAPYKPDPNKQAEICRGDLDTMEALTGPVAKKDAGEALPPDLQAVFTDFNYNPLHDEHLENGGAVSSSKSGLFSAFSSSRESSSDSPSGRDEKRARRQSKLADMKIELATQHGSVIKKPSLIDPSMSIVEGLENSNERSSRRTAGSSK